MSSVCNEYLRTKEKGEDAGVRLDWFNHSFSQIGELHEDTVKKLVDVLFEDEAGLDPSEPNWGRDGQIICFANWGNKFKLLQPFFDKTKQRVRIDGCNLEGVRMPKDLIMGFQMHYRPNYQKHIKAGDYTGCERILIQGMNLSEEQEIEVREMVKHIESIEVDPTNRPHLWLGVRESYTLKMHGPPPARSKLDNNPDAAFEAKRFRETKEEHTDLHLL